MKLIGSITVAKRPIKGRAEVETRDRIDLRAEPEWVARVMRQAKRLGISASAYIRLSVTHQLERDEQSERALDPKPAGK